MTQIQPARLATFSVGLEEGPDGWTRAHALNLPGCAAEGESTGAALSAFASELAAWLSALARSGEPVPSREAELELAVDEWIRTDAKVREGESDVCFEADLRRLTGEDIDRLVRRFGDLRGTLLAAVRGASEAELDAKARGDWTPRQILDELARAQWWTLSRLGASPMAEVPARTVARLDTAAALVVDRFTTMAAESFGTVIELDGETWTPRKVLRRLLWLEWALGRAFEHSLQDARSAGSAAG
jgi:hypothetical protein